MDASSSSLSVSSDQPQIYRFEFHGKAGEYFRIWIVNVVLTLLTLGVFSAWAKVRARRYFYNNTFVNGASFDYHADPIKILRGRVIFAIFFTLYYLGEFYWPLKLMIVVFMGLFPWLMVRGMIFNMVNTSYRGIRFGFERDYKGSYRNYFLAMAYWILSLGALAGVSFFLHEQFRVSRSRFGHSKFTFSGQKWVYWRIWLSSLVFVFLGLIWLVASVALSKVMGRGGSVGIAIMSLIGVLGFYGLLGFMVAFLRANLSNYVFAHTKAGPIQLRSKYNSFDLFLVYLGNFFATALTLGLAYPWARIELAKYRASTTALEARAGDFDSFIQAESQGGEAVGDQVLDFWDIDIGF